MKKLNKILLIDDNPADNRYHRLIIEEMDITKNIVTAEDGLEALNLLKKENQQMPELIFLDINMPKMNGWEFLDEFAKLPRKQINQSVLIVLSTSANIKDIRRAQEIPEVSNFETKPLTKESIENIIEHYFE